MTAERAGERAAPTLLALDEMANIAPLPDVAAMVSEGAGQGLLVTGVPPGPLPGPAPLGLRRPTAGSRSSVPR